MEARGNQHIDNLGILRPDFSFRRSLHTEKQVLRLARMTSPCQFVNGPAVSASALHARLSRNVDATVLSDRSGIRNA